MELSNIEKLLKKYENAETSLQEEQVLKNYFNNKMMFLHIYWNTKHCLIILIKVAKNSLRKPSN